jgi:hypothetical protein
MLLDSPECACAEKKTFRDMIVGPIGPQHAVLAQPQPLVAGHEWLVCHTYVAHLPLGENSDLESSRVTLCTHLTVDLVSTFLGIVGRTTPGHPWRIDLSP